MKSGLKLRLIVFERALLNGATYIEMKSKRLERKKGELECQLSMGR